jgi:hypothetical protein
MIRLSCWIGAMGCTVRSEAVHEERSAESDLAPSPINQRCIDTDLDEKERFKLWAFTDAASRLARKFHPVDQDREAGQGELRESWRRYKDMLTPHRGIGRPEDEVVDMPGVATKTPNLVDSLLIHRQ